MTTSPVAATPAEYDVIRRLTQGLPAEFSNETDENRTITASFLRELAVWRLTNVNTTPMAISIERAIIVGALELASIGSTTAPLPPLSLTNCEIMGDVYLGDSAWTSVNLSRSRICGLTAAGLRVERNLLLNDVELASKGSVTIDLRDVVVGANLEARRFGCGREHHCRLLLDQAHVGGSVLLTGSSLSAWGEDRRALSMNGMTVNADCLLNSTTEHRFEITGDVSVVNATIGGRVSFRGARVDNAGIECLVMDGTRVGGDVLFDDHEGQHFEANGAVCLRGVSLRSSIDLTGATLVGRPDSLLLIGAQIGANFISKRLHANGAIGLTRATIGGEVRMQGASLSGTKQSGKQELFALYMNESVVRGSVFLCSDGTDRFEAKGLVDLYSAQLDRNLVMNGANVGQHLDITEVGVVYDRTIRALRPHNAEHISKGMAVDLRQARIRGKALLGAADEHRFEARGLVCLNGATIGSELFLRGARLSNNLRYTLSLNSAEIARDVFLDSSSTSRFESRGSVSGWGCTIGGGLRCKGALFRQREPNKPSGQKTGDEEFLPTERGDPATIREDEISPTERLDQAIPEEFLPAMRFDQATIRGEVFLLHTTEHPFVAKGSVLFEHARIEGDVKCDGACLFGKSEIALSLADAVITGGVLLTSSDNHRFEGRGQICLDRAQIGGNLDLTGARIRNPRIADKRDEPSATAKASAGGIALHAVDVSIGGDVHLCCAVNRRFKARGQIVLAKATIKGRLHCRGAKLHGERLPQGYRREERFPVLSLYSGVVNDKIVMEASEDYPFEAIGFVDLSHTRIGAGIICTATYFDNPLGTALSLESAKVTGDVYLTDADAKQPGRFREFRSNGDVDLQAVEISGDLSCDGSFRSERQGPDEKDQGKALIFDNGRVSHRWYVRLKSDSVGEASMRGGRVGDLDDDGGNNWGDIPTEYRDNEDKKRTWFRKRVAWRLPRWLQLLVWGEVICSYRDEAAGTPVLRGIKLRLDGFTYDRFGPWEPPKEPTDWFERPLWWLAKNLDLGVRQNMWVSRCEWLKRQYRGDNPKPEDFFPQPHEQAAKALFAMGHSFDSRRVVNDRSAHQTRCNADEVLSRLFMSLYRLGFGCGYLPNRALFTTVCWWLIGFLVTWFALSQWHGVILVKAATSTEIIRSFDNPDVYNKRPQFDPRRDVRKDDGSVIYGAYERIETRDIACTSDDIDAGLYALDTMLPVLDLHMEEKCEVSSDRPISRFLKALYAMVGWIIVALAAFTCTGAFRRIPN